MAQFFINRPIFAWVMALLILLAGIISMNALPITAYPNIAPPVVTVTATYPGASAQVIENTVTTVVEEEMNGIEGLKYVKSDSSRAGTATIALTFESGTDIDIAGVEVQNRIKRVEARLPSAVRTQGVLVDKTRPDFLMVVAIFSPNGTHNATDLGDYTDRAILGDIRRVQGVGSAQSFGSKYAMRIWLDPKKMASFAITADEILSAIQSQNAQLATGELGSLPSLPTQQLNATILVPAQLSTVEEFSSIIVRGSDDGATVRLGDIAEVEHGSNNYSSSAYLNGQDTAAFAIKLSSDGNALAAAAEIKAVMADLAQNFPEDMDWAIPYDTSIFVDVSIKEVIVTLLQAVFLVTLVMFLFLQNWRTTVIPLIVIPISLIGTGIGLLLFGFSINMLTMFGMVLAIGTVVDDAIVVVENVERIMEQEGLGPYRATAKAMKQISGAIVGTTVVLVAVFIPMAFFSGSVGKIYQQFSLTIVFSVTLSSVLALSLSPAIAQGLLKAKKSKAKEPEFSRRFNAWFDRMTDKYMSVAQRFLSPKGIKVTMIAFIGLCLFCGWRFMALPTGFVPSEDQGFIVSSSMLPPGATESRTLELTKKIDKWFLEQPEVSRIITITGFSFFGSGQNTSLSFIGLKPWEERTELRDADALAGAASQQFQQYQEGMSFAFNMPPIPGLGNSNGFDLQLQDKASLGLPALNGALYQLMGQTMQSGKFADVRPDTLPPAPLLKLHVDRVKAKSLGIDIGSLNLTLQLILGSAYVNDYFENGKVHQVWMQADARTRSTPDEILHVQVRNNNGKLIDLAEIATAEWTEGPAKLSRYNGYPSIPLTGTGAPGISSGEVMKLVEEYGDALPAGIGYEWSGQSLEEKIAGNQTAMLFGLSFLIVFLVLAALYESWSIPIAVLLVVPLGLLGCIIGMELRGMPNDIYFKVGMIAIIGLSAKNAILIVEFARDLEHQGRTALQAVTEACRLRFRPILMTSLSFIMGVIPLVLTSGAGAASRHAIGTGVLGGMITATLFGIFFIPAFYLLVRSIFPSKAKHDEPVNTPAENMKIS